MAKSRLKYGKMFHGKQKRLKIEWGMFHGKQKGFCCGFYQVKTLKNMQKWGKIALKKAKNGQKRDFGVFFNKILVNFKNSVKLLNFKSIS